MSELLHSPDAELAALKARVARLERLEEQVYFQERTLSALNEAITPISARRCSATAGSSPFG